MKQPGGRSAWVQQVIFLSSLELPTSGCLILVPSLSICWSFFPATSKDQHSTWKGHAQSLTSDGSVYLIKFYVNSICQQSEYFPCFKNTLCLCQCLCFHTCQSSHLLFSIPIYIQPFLVQIPLAKVMYLPTDCGLYEKKSNREPPFPSYVLFARYLPPRASLSQDPTLAIYLEHCLSYSFQSLFVCKIISHLSTTNAWKWYLKHTKMSYLN